MSAEPIVLAQMILPPTEDRCTAGFCAQRACCTIEVRVDALNRRDVETEEFYVLSLCPAHALHVLTAPVDYAMELYPPDQADVPPWERSEE